VTGDELELGVGELALGRQEREHLMAEQVRVDPSVQLCFSGVMLDDLLRHPQRKMAMEPGLK
jgi:hypothetical protein